MDDYLVKKNKIHANSQFPGSIKRNKKNVIDTSMYKEEF